MNYRKYCLAGIFVLALGTLVSAAQPDVTALGDFGSFRISVIQANGSELKQDDFSSLREKIAKKEDLDFLEKKLGEQTDLAASGIFAPGICSWHCFLHHDRPIVVLICFDPVSKAYVFRIESPILRKGDIGFGLEAFSEKHLPKSTVGDKQVSINLARVQAQLAWSGTASFVAPKPRKKLLISLVEYGATDRWRDVTEKVNDQVVCDTLLFQATNAFFGGDPAPGIPKTIVFNYTLDDDEEFREFRESQRIGIQYDPKDRFFRLTPSGADSFEFILKPDGTLPEKRPTLNQALESLKAIPVLQRMQISPRF